MDRVIPIFFVLGILGSLPLTVEGQPLQLSGDPSPGDRFGFALALAEPFLFVGAPGDSEVEDEGGAVFIFRRSGREWLLEAKVRAPRSDGAKRFGVALDASESTLVAAARNRHLDDSGLVYVFERRGRGRWSLRARLRPERPAVADGFGSTLAVVGDTLVVAAPGVAGRADKEGIVYVYDRGGDGAWTRSGVLRSPRPAFLGTFGYSVGFDGKRIVVGAPGEGGADGPTGAIYLYGRGADSSTWELQARLSGTSTSREVFGRSVALHGRYILVGAPVYHGDVNGAAYVVCCATQGAGGMKVVARLQGVDGVKNTGFGYSVAMNRDVIAVGALHDDALGEDTGALHVFERAGDEAHSWHEIGVVHRNKGASGDRFGSNLRLDGATLAASAPGARQDAGAVLAYDVADSVRIPRISFRRVAHPEDGLLNGQVEALLPDQKGFLWIGSFAGLNRFDGRDFTAYVHHPDDSSSLSNGVVLSLLEDRSGRLWVGTEDGLNRYEPAKDGFIRYPLASDGTFPRQSIRVVFEDREGRIWTGTNGRLYLYSADADRFDLFDPFKPPVQKLDETYISGIQQDNAGRLWILAKNLWELRASLYRLDTAAEELVRYVISPEWGQVGPLYVDSRDRLWIKGPVPITLPHDHSRAIRPEVPPILTPHWNFFEDQAGSVWMATAKGVYRSEGNASGTEFFEIMPGATGHLANFVRSIHQTRSGQILLGTTDGVFLVREYKHPEKEQDLKGTQASLVLTRIHLIGRDGERSVNPYGTDEITLSYRDYRLALEFVVPAIRTEDLRYRYRLHGYDHDWIEAGNRGLASYANVPSGRYRFEVEAASDVNLAHLTIPVVVTPPLWGTWWFRVLGGAVLLGSVYAVHRLRLNRLLQIERLRTRIASDLHDEVTSNLSGIALMSEFIRENASLQAVEKRQLARVAASARRTADDLRDIIWFIDPNRDRLDALLLRMKDTASSLLNGIAYEFRVGGEDAIEALGMEHRRQIFLIYKEALHNVVRHAGAGCVEIEIMQDGGVFTMTLRDDGVGFDPGVESAGQGLRNMQRRARSIGGRLEVESRPGGGARVTLMAELDHRPGRGRDRFRSAKVTRTGDSAARQDPLS